MLPEINNGSVPLSASQSLFLCSAVHVFHAPSACSPVSPGLTGPAIKPHVDWLGRCADIPRCDPAPLPLLLTAPRIVGVRGMRWKGAVIQALGGPVPFECLTVFAPTVCWCAARPSAAATPRLPCPRPCVPLPCAHGRGHAPRWQPPLNPEATVGRAGDRETAPRQSWIYTECLP